MHRVGGCATACGLQGRGRPANINRYQVPGINSKIARRPTRRRRTSTDTYVDDTKTAVRTEKKRKGEKYVAEGCCFGRKIRLVAPWVCSEWQFPTEVFPLLNPNSNPPHHPDRHSRTQVLARCAFVETDQVAWVTNETCYLLMGLMLHCRCLLVCVFSFVYKLYLRSSFQVTRCIYVRPQSLLFLAASVRF